MTAAIRSLDGPCGRPSPRRPPKVWRARAVPGTVLVRATRSTFPLAAPVLAVAVVLLAVTSGACGGRRAPATTPRLPGEGEARSEGSARLAAQRAEREADPWAGRTDLIQPPPTAPPAPLLLPQVERFTLPNGLRVLVVAGHDLPQVSFRLAIPVGEQDESRDRRSLASFVAAMLTKGTAKRDADQLADAIDLVGGSLSATTDLEGTFVTCDVLSKDVETCLQLLPEIVVSPSFPEREMAEVRDQFISAVREVRDDAGALASEHFENALWGDGHPRGWPTTEATVRAIGRADLVAWHRAWYRPNGAVLAVAGDVDPWALEARLRRGFAGWRRGAAPARKEAAMPVLSGLRVRLVDKPDQTQSHLIIGGLGVAHADADFIPTVVMNYSLGGGAFSSRLMTVVRSEGGKSYGASSSFERWRRRGEFRARTFTRTAETVATLELVLGELAKMRDRGPNQTELDAAKANLSGSYPLRFQTSNAVASALLTAELHRLGADYVRDFALAIGAVTLDQARAAARTHLDPANAVVVIVGRGEAVAPLLHTAGIGFEQVGHLEPISKLDRERGAASSAPAP